MNFSPEMQEKINNTILVVDFDDTITIAGPFPQILGLQPGAQETLQALGKLGFQIIINTCRLGESQDQVKTFLESLKIPFNYINENHETIRTLFGFDCRKIYGDFMIDDKCLFFKQRQQKEMPWNEIAGFLIETVVKDENYQPLISKLQKC